MTTIVLTYLFSLTILFTIGAGIINSIFAMMSSAGLVCSGTESNGRLPKTLINGIFSTNKVCWASGVQLEKGKRYKISLFIDNDWIDSTVRTGVGGFFWREMTPLMYSGLLMRRHLGEPWFKPIARIGDTGTDEYPLNPADQSIPDRNERLLTAEITARHDGELFFFVNDAALPVPENWQYFYKNNRGTAKIKVVPIDERNY